MYQILRVFCFAMLLIIVSCVTTQDLPQEFEELSSPEFMDAPAISSQANEDQDRHVRRGRYMTELIGCGTCHTDGALIGEPDFDRWLAGSSVGIAYTNPLRNDRPGVVYPSNLTSDSETGLGRWTDAEIKLAIRFGTDRHGFAENAVMPWPVYTKISDEDVAAIIAYLRSLPPIRHQVPKAVNPGRRAKKMFVHFGVYRSVEP